MGHIRLGTLPRTCNWKQVVALLNHISDPAQVASATLKAASRVYTQIPKDPGVAHAFWLLTQIPLEARQDDFFHRLKDYGIEVSSKPTALEFASAFANAVDQHVRKHGGRSDPGEMAQLAASETITHFCSSKTQTLFGTTAEDLRLALKDLSTQKQFSLFAKDFLGRFTQRYLSYFLSRELANHIGPGQPLPNIKAHSEFNEALRHYCHQAARIVEEFGGGWYSKTNFFEGRITPEKAQGFLYVALKKIYSELRREGLGDAE